MVEKRRGLGRGLSALIPDTQKETGGRPTDVFFPSQNGTSLNRQHSDLSETLMAPTIRKSSKKRTASTSSSKGGSKNKGDEGSLGVSRETLGDLTDAVGAERESVSRETLRSVPQASDRDIDVDAPSSLPKRADRDFVNQPGSVSRETGITTNDDLIPVPGATFAELSVGTIDPNPRQPREVFDDDDIEELSASIKEVGLLQPIVVRRALDSTEEAPHYELIMGERRLRATKLAGLDTIPAVVRHTDDSELLRDALLENLHRVALNPLEEAAAYQQLLDDFGCTHVELSERIARSRSQISNTLRLMKLPPTVQRRLAAGVISAGHARALLGLPDPASMEKLTQRIVAEGLSVRATEELVALHDDPLDTPVSRPRAKSAVLQRLSQELSNIFDTRVKVTKGVKKGKIVIEFAGDDDLQRLIASLQPGLIVDEQ
ncbi:ParB/RepB/Spo0J family partition protein [Actinomyces vulturis]|uniref:ParB/RepB/Spo0J family partition protein n=1 Tax=Actinomyces vulturis TaxID=1857645 RepID=UPI00082F7BF8|nr:ParB/RepB/Spo0J family partition protein [Actinomyces vulturis]